MKFNSLIKESDTIVNHEGELAYLLSPEMELYSTVVTASLSDKFYESDSELMNRILELVGQVSPEFVAKLAVYTRTEMHLRSVPLLLVVALAKVHSGDDLVARTVEHVVQRADEIMELLMCYQLLNPSEGRKKLGRLSHQIQCGLQRAFNNFDEYQFAKYNRGNLEVKLRDALFIVHPKAKDDAQQAIFDKIVEDKLTVPYTWETELSALGQKKYENEQDRKDAFREKWEELISSRKVGYMALLRNLRNMLVSGVSPVLIDQVCAYLSSPQNVLKSKQLPFRYLSAYREIDGIDNVSTTMVLSALEDAMKASADNISGFDGDTRTLIACDVSGSMWSLVSQRSKVRLFDIGIVLAMLFKNRCKQVVTGMFGTEWKVFNYPNGNILPAITEMERHEGEVGYSTNGYKVVEWLLKDDVVMDKVLIFTDCQMWNSQGDGNTFAQLWSQYKRRAPKAQLYLFDLAGYGQMPLRMEQDDVFLIGGWSDRIFDVISDLQNANTVVDAINNIEL